MSMTLEQVREKAYAIRTNIESTRNAFPDNWQDWFNEVVEDLTEIIDDISRQSDGPSEDVVKKCARDMYEAVRTESPRACMYRWEDQTFQPTIDYWMDKARAALTAVWHNRPVQYEFSAHPSGDGCIVRNGSSVRLTTEEILAAMNNRPVGVVSAEDRFEQYVASLIARDPDVRELGERLALWLDDDKFNTVEPILLGIASRHAPAKD